MQRVHPDPRTLAEEHKYEHHTMVKQSFCNDTGVFSIASAKPGKSVPLMCQLSLTGGLSNRNVRLQTNKLAGPMDSCRGRAQCLCFPFGRAAWAKAVRLGAVTHSFCENNDFCEYYSLLMGC